MCIHLAIIQARAGEASPRAIRHGARNRFLPSTLGAHAGKAAGLVARAAEFLIARGRLVEGGERADLVVLRPPLHTARFPKGGCPGLRQSGSGSLYDGFGTCYIEFGGGRIGKVEVDFF